MLILLERVLACYLPAPDGHAVRVDSVRLEADTVELRLHAPEAARWLSGSLPVRIRVAETAETHSILSLELPLLPALGRLVGAGLRTAVGRRLGELLTRRLGEGVQVEGDRIVLHHAALARRLLRGEPPDASQPEAPR